MIIPTTDIIYRKRATINETDIVGKKASIIKLCQQGKLKPRKCRKYR